MSSVTVPFVNLAKEASEIKGELLEAVGRVLESGNYILGPETAAFEKEFAAYCGTEFSLGISNATDALHLLLRGLDLKEGDEVITASNSFIASASTIALAGGTPVFADIGEDLNLDPAQVEAAITKRTRAIMPVHLTGRPARMTEIMEIAKKHKLFVLEDSAQAFGAKLGGKVAGSIGHAAVFSLHPLKNLHAFGDGGMITTNDPKIYEQMTRARNHGLKNRNECDSWSFNCRLDEIQAAMLRIQLKNHDRLNAKKRELASRYNELLGPFARVPVEAAGEHHVYQTYIIQVDRRDDLLKHLNDNGVEARVHYPLPIHRQKAAESLGYTDADLPVTARMSKRIISLPLYAGMTHAQQDQVANLFRRFFS